MADETTRRSNDSLTTAEQDRRRKFLWMLFVWVPVGALLLGLIPLVLMMGEVWNFFLGQ
jgi:hypothetical protein